MFKPTYIAALFLTLFSSSVFSGSLSITSAISEPIDLSQDTQYFSINILLPNNLDADDDIVVGLFKGAYRAMEENLKTNNPSVTVIDSSPVTKRNGTVVIRMAEAVEPEPVILASSFTKSVYLRTPTNGASGKPVAALFPEEVGDTIKAYLNSAQGVELWSSLTIPVTRLPQAGLFNATKHPVYKTSAELPGAAAKTYIEAYSRLVDQLKNDIRVKCAALMDEEKCETGSPDFDIRDSLVHINGEYSINIDVMATY